MLQIVREENPVFLYYNDDLVVVNHHDDKEDDDEVVFYLKDFGRQQHRFFAQISECQNKKNRVHIKTFNQSLIISN